MNYRKTKLTAIAVSAILLQAWISARACSVPVFRYALERWIPDDYTVVITSAAPLSNPINKAIDNLRESGINLNIQTGNTQSLTTTGGNGELQMYFPASVGISKPIWTGPLSTNTILSIMTSPMRDRIANMILNGESVIWLMLEGSDPQQNSAAHKLLEEELRHNQSILKLPLIDESDTHIAEAAGRAPLKIAFSMLTLSRNNPDETVLVNTLLNSNPEYLKTNEPMVFPICGAGRAFPPLIGTAINAEHINLICLFLTGECSCEIKGQNPGFDLPIATDWGCAECGQLYTETVLPPLTGVIPEAKTETQPKTTPKAEKKSLTANTPVKPPHSDTQNTAQKKTTSPLAGTVIITIAAMAVAVVTISIIIRRKTG